MAKASRKIKTVIIGLGNIAHKYDDNGSVRKRIKYPTHFSAIKKDKKFILVGASDLSQKSRNLFAKKVNQSVNIYHDYLVMVKKEKPDLVVVATPTPTHCKICSDLISLGVKNILCEKPISYSFKEAKKLVDLARKNKVNLVFNYLRSFDQSYNKLIQAIKNNKFGEVVSIDIKYSNGLFNTATHLINLLQNMFGPVQDVIVFPTQKKYKDIDPTVSFVVKFGETVAFFEGVNSNNYRILEMDVLFSKSRIKIINDKLEEYRPVKINNFSFLHLLKNSQYKIDINKSMLDVYSNVYSNLIFKKKPLCSANQALETLAVADKVINLIK